MSKKLLHTTTNHFLIFSVLSLVISAPLFYYITNHFYVEETDESILAHKQDFIRSQLPSLKISDIALWNKYNRNESLIPSKKAAKDTLFTKYYYDKLKKENQPYRQLNSPVLIENKQYTYVTKINLIEKKEIIESIVLLFLSIIIMLMAGVLLIVKISSKRLWKPFYNTLKQIKGFELDKNNTPVFIPTEIEEFNQLNKNLSRLIEKNISVYQNQKEFAENAAHELQTPLALFQTKIDNLLQLELSKEQLHIITSLNKDISRLNRLNRNLLLLSKIDNENYVEKSPLLINHYIEKHLDFFTEQAKAKNITIVTEFATTLSINGNPALTEVLINNLFLNAIRHNEKDGKIIICIKNSQLTFSNTGQPTPLAVDKLFNRFTKICSPSHGNGLGLSIIKKIAEINQWQINYIFDGKLHNFRIVF